MNSFCVKSNFFPNCILPQPPERRRESVTLTTIVMADGRSSASIVAVDPKHAAEERDRAARLALSDTIVQPLMPVVLTGVAYTVPYTLKVIPGPNDDTEKVKVVLNTVLHEALNRCNEVFNCYNPASEVSVINSRRDLDGTADDRKHQMSPDFAFVIRHILKLVQASGESFDPATAPVCFYLRKFLTEKKRLPSTPEELEEKKEIQKYSTMRMFEFDFPANKMWKKHPNAALDFGGVAKGHAVDQVIEAVQRRGFCNAFFEWGGDVKGMGMNQRNEPWKVGIVRPPPLKEIRDAVDESKASFLAVISLDNESLCTSGDYRMLLEDSAGALYTTTYSTREHTLIRPTEDQIAQVSVRATSCLYADALATAAFVKRSFLPIRGLIERYRYSKYAVTDFSAYIRRGELVAKMHEIGTESPEMRMNRIALGIPARVVVIGGGLAGLCAAIEAYHCGASVVLIEKNASLGGNSAKATSGINGWGTRPQSELEIQDGAKYFERDTYLSGLGGKTDPGLVRVLSIKSAEAIHWLWRRFGIPLTILSQLGGHCRPRTHRAPDKSDGTPVPIGYTIMQTLIQYVKTRCTDRISVLCDTHVVELLHTSSAEMDGHMRVHVRGVVYRKTGSEDPNENIELTSDAVILATGGFAADHTASSLLTEFAPQLSAYPTTNGAWATGDGVKLARAIGAGLVDMDKVQMHPTGFLDPKDPTCQTKYLGPEALRGSGGILLNGRGERFVNELGLRSVVSKAIFEQKDIYPKSNGCCVAYCVLNQKAIQLFGQNSLRFYKDNLGLFRDAKNVEELSTLIGAPVGNVRATLQAYGETSSACRQCPITGKLDFPCVVGPEGPFVVAIITPSIHYTMGGVTISPSAEVQSTETTGVFGTRRPILGLFGAGEVTGGVHGNNRLGGNSLLECVVFGRIAGDRAATIIQKKRFALSEEWSPVILREIRDGGVYGQGSRVLRFNLPGAMQVSGLRLGQFVSIRGEWDGQQLVGYYSPITLPADHGVIGLLVRVDKGTLKEWLSALRPGDAVYMRACGGLLIRRMPSLKCFQFEGRNIRKLGMIAGGTGVAPMLQLIRAVLKDPFRDAMEAWLIYAAEEITELTYMNLLQSFRKEHKGFRCRLIVNEPPPGWTEGVGFVGTPTLKAHMFAPCDNSLIVLCGPPVMQRAVKALLGRLGHKDNVVHTVDEQPMSHV